MIKLNPKSSLQPKLENVKKLKLHPLTQEYQLLRRVIVDVKPGTSEVSAGISFNFHPKLRRCPLQFLTVKLSIDPLVTDDAHFRYFQKLYGTGDSVYFIDLMKDLPSNPKTPEELLDI